MDADFTDCDPPLTMGQSLTAFYRSAERMRSRSVGKKVLSATLEVPAPSAQLMADWQREVVRLGLEHGDVEPLPLARARTRWPDYRRCVQAMADWTATLGMGGALAASEVALMACIGTRYHHDGAHYGGKAFCNLFLGSDQGLDLHFPALGLWIPLGLGTAVIFDTGQPHAIVVRRNAAQGSNPPAALAQHFSQMFLTWELPIEDSGVAQGLGVQLGMDPGGARLQAVEGVCVDGAPAQVCPDTGAWVRPSKPQQCGTA